MVFRLERDREKKLAANGMIVPKKESQIMEHIKTRLCYENQRLKTTVSKLSHLRLVRYLFM